MRKNQNNLTYMFEGRKTSWRMRIWATRRLLCRKAACGYHRQAEVNLFTKQMLNPFMISIFWLQKGQNKSLPCEKSIFTLRDCVLIARPSSILSRFVEHILKLSQSWNRLHFQDVLCFWELQEMQLVQKFCFLQLQVASIVRSICITPFWWGCWHIDLISFSVIIIIIRKPWILHTSMVGRLHVPIVLLHWWWFSW